MVHKILIVGAGNIGLRHIESLYNLSSQNKIKIEVHAKDIKDLKYLGDKFSTENFSILFLKESETFPRTEYKLGIFSTTADIRLSELQKSLLTNVIDYVLLEKPLATTIEDLNKIEELNCNDKFYVNLPREYMNDYRKLKQKNLKSIRRIIIRGGAINLASNSLHFLRLIEWLSDSTITSLRLSKNSKKVESQYLGYYELFGSFLGKTDSDCHFELSSVNNSEPISIVIEFENLKTLKCYELDSAINSIEHSIDQVKFEYQSSLTARYLLEILDQKSLNLPKFSQVKHLEEMTIPILVSAGLIDNFGRLKIH